MGKRHHKFAKPLFFLLLGACCIPAPGVRAEDAGRFTILEENDSLFFNSDKHYTQGLRLSGLSPTLKPESGWNELFNFIGRNTPAFQSSPDRRIAVFLGQSIFTPKNLNIRPPDPRDRPYAGWLYLGASLLQDTKRSRISSWMRGLSGRGRWPSRSRTTSISSSGSPRQEAGAASCRTSPASC